MDHVAGRSASLDLQHPRERMPIGSPMHPAFIGLLEELFAEEGFRVAAAIPFRPATFDRVSAAGGLSTDRALRTLDTQTDEGAPAGGRGGLRIPVTRRRE